MFSILQGVWRGIYSLKPAFISRNPHFNFITIHYFYIIGVAIFGSICLYPNGNLAYIDAIFLSSGGATQSGLNTVNLNALNTWQQIVLYIVPMMTNPIWINTFVVFLRLYWFEKRFQHYKLARKNNRRTISQALSQSRTNERNTGEEERGVEGRNIVVMHNTSANGAAQNNTVYRDQDNQEIKKDVAQSSDESGGHDERGSLESLKRRVTNEVPSQPQIKFADQVKRSNGLTDRTLSAPIHRRDEEHIAFLQRQRNPDDGAVLRIPGPRDADAGIPPTAVDESEAIRQIYSRQSSYHGSRHGGQDFEAFDDVDYSPNADQLRPRNITIEEPSPSGAVDKVAEDAHAAKKVFGIFRPRKARILKGEKLHEENSELNPARSRANTFQSLKTAFSQGKDEPTPYLSWEPTVGRNSMFVDLTESQREELGGIEYRSLKSLALILIAYFVGFSTFGVVCLIPWIYETKTYGSIVQQDGQGRGWWAVYTSNSAFTDLGFTLTPDSMISFNTATWPLLLLSFLIIIGNTGFPVMLRIIIWVTSKYVPSGSGIYEELKFLLDHPRRCFTLLFPAKATWWLFWILVLMNGIDLIFFIILDLGNTVVTELSIRTRILDGWFQAVSTRTAGFGVVDLADLHPAIQVSYLIMMYISVLPIAISVRRTNVYEEKSLGIYGSQEQEADDEAEPSYVGAHLRRQLSFDLWYIFLGFFIISIAEGSRLQAGDPAFTMFAVLFEIVSAYGTVGLSLGYTGIDASLSAEFGVVAKLVIIAMQIRGRHRGLPYELDRAILLPSEHLQEKEAADAASRLHRRSSAGDDEGVAASSGARINSRGRSRSGQRSASNFLGSLLHPGPTIPNSHRDSGRQNFPLGRKTSRGTLASARSPRNASPDSVAMTSPWGESSKENGGLQERRSVSKEDATIVPSDTNGK